MSTLISAAILRLALPWELKYERDCTCVQVMQVLIVSSAHFRVAWRYLTHPTEVEELKYERERNSIAQLETLSRKCRLPCIPLRVWLTLKYLESTIWKITCNQLNLQFRFPSVIGNYILYHTESSQYVESYFSSFPLLMSQRRLLYNENDSAYLARYRIKHRRK